MPGTRRGEPLGDVGLQRRIEIRAVDEEPALGLIGDRGDDFGMRMAGGRDHAAREVEKDVAIDVLEQEPAGLFHDDRRGLGAGGQKLRLGRDNPLAFGAGQLVGGYLRRGFQHTLAFGRNASLTCLQKMGGMPKAVGFDFDHTLGVDNKLERIAFVAVVHELAQREHRGIDDAVAYASIDREIALFRAGSSSLHEALGSAFRSVLGAEVPADAEQLFRDRAVGLVPQYVQILPGVRELLSRLDAAMVPYAILTNGWNPLQQRKADHIGFHRPVLVSEDLGVRKPQREAFWALAKLFAADPPAIVYVGDDPVVDIGGALAAGMQAIWFRWEAQTYPDGMQPPTATVARITDVFDYL